jgi:TonB family protein
MAAHMPFKLITAIVVAATVLSVAANGTALTQQEPWQKIAPVGESFTILMPTLATEVLRRIPLNDKDWLPGREYYSLAGGKRYMVVSFVKTSADRVPALSSFDNFMRAIEQSFKGSEAESRSLTFDDNTSDESGIVMQYHLKLGKYPGVARFLAREKAFYALIVIGVDERDSEAQRFLTSFADGEVNTSAQSSGVRVPVIVGDGTITNAVRAASSDLPPEPWPKTLAPISGGVLNGRAISLVVPKYPKEAKKARDSGQVRVQVLIDEQGIVVSAKAIEGPDSLREVAVRAALQSRFTPTRLMGQPVKVNGVIIYNFVAQ